MMLDVELELEGNTKRGGGRSRERRGKRTGRDGAGKLVLMTMFILREVRFLSGGGTGTGAVRCPWTSGH